MRLSEELRGRLRNGLVEELQRTLERAITATARRRLVRVHGSCEGR